MGKIADTLGYAAMLASLKEVIAALQKRDKELGGELDDLKTNSLLAAQTMAHQAQSLQQLQENAKLMTDNSLVAATEQGRQAEALAQLQESARLIAQLKTQNAVLALEIEHLKARLEAVEAWGDASLPSGGRRPIDGQSMRPTHLLDDTGRS